MTKEEIFTFSKTVPYRYSALKQLNIFLLPEHRNVEMFREICERASAKGTSIFDVAYDINFKNKK